MEFFLLETFYPHRYLNSKYTKPEIYTTNKISLMKPNWHPASTGWPSVDKNMCWLEW